MDFILVTIEEYDNPHQADIARICLEAEDIPVHLENRFIVEADWFLSNAVGNIRLQVPPEHQDQARKLLAQLKSTAVIARNETKGFETVTCLSCRKPMGEDDEACVACGWSYTDRTNE